MDRSALNRWTLLGEKKADLLTLPEVERYGSENSGDADYVSLYGFRPAEWYARGVRIAGRTAVECTRDRLADLIGRDISAVAARTAAGAVPLAVDLFAGSGNTLFWIKRHLPRPPGDGLVVLFVAPSWGRALSEESGLDLRGTSPPVAQVMRFCSHALGARPMLFGVQLADQTEQDSLAEVTALLAWSALRMYDINAPGHRAGLLVGTTGWSPDA